MFGRGEEQSRRTLRPGFTERLAARFVGDVAPRRCEPIPPPTQLNKGRLRVIVCSSHQVLNRNTQERFAFKPIANWYENARFNMGHFSIVSALAGKEDVREVFVPIAVHPLPPAPPPPPPPPPTAQTFPRRLSNGRPVPTRGQPCRRTAIPRPPLPEPTRGPPSRGRARAVARPPRLQYWEAMGSDTEDEMLRPFSPTPRR